MDKPICDGCNVLGVHEHRCHQHGQTAGSITIGGEMRHGCLCFCEQCHPSYENLESQRNKYSLEADDLRRENHDLKKQLKKACVIPEGLPLISIVEVWDENQKPCWIILEPDQKAAFDDGLPLAGITLDLHWTETTVEAHEVKQHLKLGGKQCQSQS